MTNVIVFCDIDSTLADTRHRQTGQTEGVDWHEYAMQSGRDGVIEGVATLVRTLHWRGVPIILFSTRWKGAWDLTRWWLDRHKVPYDHLVLAEETPPTVEGVVEWKIGKVAQWLERLGPGWSALVIEDSAPTAEALEMQGHPVVLVQPPVRVPA